MIGVVPPSFPALDLLYRYTSVRAYLYTSSTPMQGSSGKSA
jgi:hypothetical protein